jgi:hypothetical protein
MQRFSTITYILIGTVFLLSACSNFQFTKLDALLYNNKLMRLQQNCDSAKLSLKTAINSMKSDSIKRTYERFKTVIANSYETWQHIPIEKNDEGLYVATGAAILMYESNMHLHYEDVIYFYNRAVPKNITQKSIEIRGLQQTAQLKEEAAYQYVLCVQARFLKRYKVGE